VPALESSGTCPICGDGAAFVAHNPWLRDNFLCQRCGSLPRERALMAVLNERFPLWRQGVLHESSPVMRGVSSRLAAECPNYTPTQFYPDAPLGSAPQGVRCENLECLTFPDGSFDLHVTQDVLEHVLDPAAAFREIARTLKPGGAHVFTVPLVNKHWPTVVRARYRPDGGVELLAEAVYHGNPISEDGALVTRDWGFDICRFIFDACGLFTDTIIIDDLSRGIRAEYIEVLVTWKPRPEA
jgi:SAM-dependent methyltransferase